MEIKITRNGYPLRSVTDVYTLKQQLAELRETFPGDVIDVEVKL